MMLRLGSALSKAVAPKPPDQGFGDGGAGMAGRLASVEGEVTALRYQCAKLESKVVELEELKNVVATLASTGKIPAEMAAAIAPSTAAPTEKKKKTAGFADTSPDKSEKGGKKHINFGGFSQDLDEVIEIENCVTGQKAAGKSVKQRIQTGAVKKQQVESDSEDSDDGGKKGKIKFDAEVGTQEKNTAKKRVPTAFAKAPVEDSDESDDGKKVKIQSEDGRGEAKGGKKRVPTAFVKPSAQDDSDEDEDERKVKIQAEEGTGEAKQGKKRVPTAFVKQPIESDEDEEEGKKVTIKAAEGTGEGKSGKKRVPTAFVKPTADDDDDEDDDEDDGGRKVTIQAEGGTEGKTGKKRTPTAFVKPAPVDDDDDDEEEERPRVKIAETAGGAEGKTGKKRTPTAFVKPTQMADDDDEDEDEDEAPRKVKISADGGAEGKTGKKRTPTAFVKRPPSEDEDEEEEGGRRVKNSAEDGAGEAKGKKRTPTAFVKPSFADDDDDEEGKKSVSFNKRESVQMIEAAEGAEISGKLHSAKKRIPTAFKKTPVVMSSEEEDDEEGEVKFEIGKTASSKARSVTMDTTVSDSESDPEEKKARAKARPSKGRIATAFIKKSESSDEDDDDDDEDKPDEAQKTEKKKKEKQKKLNFGSPSDSERRGSDEASMQGSESSKTTSASNPAILLDNFEHYRVAKGEKDADLIENSLRGLEFFADIDDTACHKVVDALSVFDFPDGTAIAKQGNRNATHFFIVAEGVFEIFRDDQKVAEVGKGKLLGESVILLNNAQNATVQCRGRAVCYGMAGARARNILQQQYRESKADVHASISGLLTDKACTCALLRNLSQGQETILYERAEKVMFSAGTILTKQGDKDMLLPGKTERHGSGVYLLLNGGIVVCIGSERQERHDYAVVGDLMMLYGEAPATVETSEASEFLLLTAEMLENMFGDGPKLRDKLLQNRIQGLLAQYELFHGFSQVQLSAIATEGKTISLSEDGSGDEIVEDRICLALVVSGENIEAQVIDEGSGPNPAWTKCSGVLGHALGMDKVEDWKSKRFETGALAPWKLKLKKTTHSNDCVVVWGSFLGTLLKVAMPRASVAGDFEGKRISMAGSMNLDISPQKRNTRMASMKMAVMMDDKVGALRSVLVFRSLSAKQLSDLAAKLEFQYASAGQAIFNQREEKADEFYIIQSGVLEVLIDGRRVRTLSVGDYVGERALLFSEPRSATVCAVEDAELWKINREDFNRIVTGAIIEYMKDRIVFQNTKVDIKSLSCLRVIGSGGYATVKMVYSSQTKTRYALKAISIKHMVQQEATVALCRERDILAELDHPFVLKFIRTFRSKQYVYYLIELVTGGELWEFVNDRGVLTKDQTRFYVGSVVLALEFLHDRRIAYLDLKGENMLIDQFGYLKIIDFGLAERVVNGKIFEPKGTPFYMAPELFGSHGYSTVADLWSLGTLTFLWMTEDFPFNFQMEDQGEPEILVKKTLHEKLTFPSTFKDPASITFISGLLTRNPADRLGAGNSGYAEIKSHAFFEGFEFDQLLSRQLTPPWVPDREVYADNAATDANIIEDVGDVTWEQVEVKGIKSGDATRACGIYVPIEDKEHNGLRYCKHSSEELYLYSADRDGARWVVSPSLGGPADSELIENITQVEERRIPPRKGWNVKEGMGSGKVKVKVEMDPDPSWMDEF